MECISQKNCWYIKEILTSSFLIFFFIYVHDYNVDEMYSICIKIVQPTYKGESWLTYDPLLSGRYAFSYGDIGEVPSCSEVAKFPTRRVARIVAQRLRKRIEQYCLGIKNYHVEITDISRDRYTA